MITKNLFFHQLKDFGLNSYESKLWVALLSRGLATAGELSDIAGVPRSRSYDVLESLEKKGFIIMKIGKPIRYLAVQPEHVLDRVKQNILEAARQQASFLENVEKSDVFSHLKILHNTGVEKVEPLELTGMLKGGKNIYSHLDYLFKQAKKTVWISTTIDGFSRKQSAFKATLRKAKERGVSIRFIVPPAAIGTISSELKGVFEVKASKDVGRYTVVDGERVVFMMADEARVVDEDVAIWVHSPFFATSFKHLFEKHWDQL